MSSRRALVRDAIRRAGGVAADTVPLGRSPAPVTTPFATSALVEGDRVRAIAVGAPTPVPGPVGFLDGVQRHAVEGHVGVAPVVRGYVAAAVLERVDGMLRVAALAEEAFLALPLARLGSDARDAFEATGLPLYETGEERPHPLLDLSAAAAVVQARRERVERDVGVDFVARHADARLVVDGGLQAFAGVPGAERLLGVIKSHETQFLAGGDQLTALTLPAGSRSSVFRRGRDVPAAMWTWYLRLHPWPAHAILHGLVRIERAPGHHVVAEADAVSRWILAERAPLAAPDGRWDRLLYPIHEVETFLRARAGRGVGE
ncbi:MAG TPA: hypothetical protein VJ992_10215 [Gemmatimonadales bacterium]|nr:hypothetical protein [Gemmatimonadales bacterium]